MARAVAPTANGIWVMGSRGEPPDSPSIGKRGKRVVGKDAAGWKLYHLTPPLDSRCPTPPPVCLSVAFLSPGLLGLAT